MAICVETLLEDVDFDLRLSLMAGGDFLDREVSHPRIQKPGLALAGLGRAIEPQRIHVLGRSEITYLSSIDIPTRDAALERLAAADPACWVVTAPEALPESLLAVASASKFAILRSAHSSGTLITRLHDFLDEHMSPEMTMHGVLIDAFGVGVLLVGSSGIGKSECALDLILRGHRLVADDAVWVRRKGSELVAMGSPVTRHHMEVRGLGIIHVKDLFGAASVRASKTVELVIEMAEWRADTAYDRTGIDASFKTILGIEIPHNLLPVRPGRNIAALVEVAARNHMLKLQGHHSARKFQKTLERRLAIEARGSDQKISPQSKDNGI